MFGLGSIIPLRTGLEVVQTEIEKEIGCKVLRFNIIMNVERDSLDFKVWKERSAGGFETAMYSYPDNIIKDTIKGLAESELKNELKNDTEILDYVVIHFDSDPNVECFANIYYTDKATGEKKQFKHVL